MVIEEAFLSADHGLLKRYEWEWGRAVPVLQEWGEDQRRSRYLSEIRQVVTTYVRKALTAGLLDDHLDHLWRGALWVAGVVPHTADAGRGGDRGLDDPADDLEHDTENERRLAGPLGSSDVLGQVAMGNLGRFQSVQRYRSEPKRHYWEEGSLALSRPWIRPLFRLAPLLRLRKFVEAPVNTAKWLRLELANRPSAGK